MDHYLYPFTSKSVVLFVLVISRLACQDNNVDKLDKLAMLELEKTHYIFWKSFNAPYIKIIILSLSLK